MLSARNGEMLEFEELRVWRYYLCELRNGQEVILHYLGDALFQDDDSEVFDFDCDVRFVFREVGGF